MLWIYQKLKLLDYSKFYIERSSKKLDIGKHANVDGENTETKNEKNVNNAMQIKRDLPLRKTDYVEVDELWMYAVE